MKSKFLVGLIIVFLAFSLVGARDFTIYNTTNPSQNYFFVNGTTGNSVFSGKITAGYFFGDGSGLTNLNVSSIDLSSYFTKSDILGFNYYNSSNFVISDYYLKSNPFSFYNSTTIPNYILTLNEADLNVNSSNYWDGLNSPSDILGSQINNDLNWINASTAGGSYVPYTGATTNVNLNAKNLVNTAKLSVGSSTASSTGVAYFNGNVGIGTTSPGAKLEISNDNAKIKLSNPSNPSNYYTTIEQHYNYAGPSFVINSVSGGTTLQILGRYSSNLAIMKDGGNVGIGTTSPGAKLEVSGGTTPSADTNIKIDTSGSTTYNPYLDLKANKPANTLSGGLRIFNGGGATPFVQIVGKTASSDTTGSLEFYTSNNEAMRITSAGNVGIGTTSPGAKLSFGTYYSTYNNVNSVRLYEFGSTLYGFGISSNLLEIHADQSPGNIGFFTNNSEKVRITTNGNVGIGTTAPSQKLSVVGGYGLIKGPSWVTTGDASTLYFGDTNHFIQSLFGQGVKISSVGGYIFLQQSTGNLGIGTTGPTQKLDVAGSIKLTGSLVYSNIPRTGSTTMGNPTYNTLSEVAFVNTAYNTNSCYWKSGTSTCLVTLYSFC